MVHRSSYTRMRVLSLSAVSILLFFLIMIFSSGVQAADDHAPIYMPVLKEIQALDAEGNRLKLQDGTENLLIRNYPGWECVRENSNNGRFQPGYLLIPNGTVSLRFVFYEVCPVLNESLGNFNTLPKISYKDVTKQIENSSNPVLTFTMEELSGTSYDTDNLVKLEYKYHSSKITSGMPDGYPQRPRCFFRILSESDLNLWIQEPESEYVDRGDNYKFNINLFGKALDEQQMDLWYQYTENGETKEVLYAENVENGETQIPVDFSRILVGDLTANNIYGDYYWVKIYAKIGDVKSNLADVRIMETSTGKITEIGLSQKTGTYSQASLWVNVGAEFKPSVADSSKVEVFFSLDEEGKDIVKDVEGFSCTVAELPSVHEAENCSYGKVKGIRIPSGMNPNTYYIIMRLTEPASEEGGEPVVTTEAKPFTVYKDANAYVKAALDNTLDWYATHGGGGFVNKAGIYVGNTEETGSGGSGLAWQAWIFPALGTEYPFDDSADKGYLFQTENNPTAAVPDVVDGKLSFSIDGPFLSNQSTGDNFTSNATCSEETHSAEIIGSKSLAVAVISSAAAGEDPRAFGKNQFNLLHEMIRYGYKNYDIEAGELNIDPDTGHLQVPPDGFAVAYALSGLEICNATPEEGYTEEYRRAGIKAILDMLKSFNAGDTPLTPDTVGMISMPLYFMTDDEVYGEEIKAELAKVGETTEKSLYANGGIGDFVSGMFNNGAPVDLTKYAGNTNSMAVMINTLVMAGNDAEEIGSWQAEDGTPLTAFIGTQRDIGDFGFSGAVSNWMATYQALGALVDLYNGETSFAIAQESYFDEYPMYTDEGDDLLKELKGITDEVDTNDDVAEITAVRASYDAFLKGLSEEQAAVVEPYYAEKAVDLVAKEAEAVEYVEELINDLPSYDLIKPSDKAAAENAREAYDALSDDQQDTVAVYEDLLRVESQFDVIAAKNVETMMYALPAADQVTVFDRVEVEAARAAYDALNEDQKSEVDGAAYGKLTAAERALLKLDAQDVVDAIDELPAVEDLKWTDKRFVEAARAAYDVLTDKQKAYVTNYDKLEALEIRLAELEDEKPSIDDMKDIAGDKDAWFYDEVSWAIGEGFFKGDDNGNFNPNQYITRAEFAQMLYNYYQNDAAVMKNGKTVKYNDVAADAWYYEAVSACSKAGIFKGDDKGNFNPNASITRQDAALVLMRIFIGEDAINAVDVDARLAELAEAGLDFADFDETFGYAQKAMAAAAGFIFNGDQNGELNPTSNITRAETATVLYNYFNTK